jgi:hypothetical protein
MLRLLRVMRCKSLPKRGMRAANHRKQKHRIIVTYIVAKSKPLAKPV